MKDAALGSVSLAAADAIMLAQRVHAALSPVTARCQIVGGVRRRQFPVSVIEVIVEYALTSDDLLGYSEMMADAVVDAMAALGTDIPGIKVHRDRIVTTSSEGVPINCYTLAPNTATWAWAILQSTGPTGYTDTVRKGLQTTGLRVDGLQVYQPTTVLFGDPTKHEVAPCDDERNLCDLAGVRYLHPRMRGNWQKHLTVTE